MNATVDGERRRLLIVLVGVPFLGSTLAACSGSSNPKSAPGTRSDVDADIKVRWTALRGERALVALYAATLAAHPALAEQLRSLAAHHDEHLATLKADGPLPFGAGDEPMPVVEAATDPAAALTALVEAERAASDARVAECLLASGPRLAAVLASIAGSEAGHAAVLVQG